MKKAKRIIAGVTIGTMLAFSLGCATYERGGNRRFEKDFTVGQRSLHNVPKTGETTTRESETIDDLLNNLQTFDKILDLGIKCECYQPEIDAIYKGIEGKRYGAVQRGVRTLATELKQDNNPCAKDLLYKLKQFTYFKYEYISAKYRHTKRLTVNPIKASGAVVMTALTIALIPFSFMYPGGIKDYFKGAVEMNKDFLIVTDSKNISKEHYKKIQVNPYYGTEKIIAESVSGKGIKK